MQTLTNSKGVGSSYIPAEVLPVVIPGHKLRKLSLRRGGKLHRDSAQTFYQILIKGCLNQTTTLKKKYPKTLAGGVGTTDGCLTPIVLG